MLCFENVGYFAMILNQPRDLESREMEQPEKPT